MGRACSYVNSIGIDSIATAGDVNRNVLCTTNPVESELHQEAYEWAKKISEHLLPKTKAYAEIWLDGEKVEGTQEKLSLCFKRAKVYNTVRIHMLICKMVGGTAQTEKTCLCSLFRKPYKNL